MMRSSISNWLNLAGRALVIAATLLILPILTNILLLTQHSEALRNLSLAMRYSISPQLVVVFLVLLICYALPGWPGRLLALTGTVLVFGLALVGLWSKGYGDIYAFGALVPWSDARTYYSDAYRLMQGWGISPLSAWRPIFVGFTAVLLTLAGHNLQITVAVMVFIAALACYLAAREVQRTHGLAAGFLTLVLLYFFYRRFAGTFSLENLGLPLGTLGFALLWRGAADRAQRPAVLGFFLLALALFTRWGALLVLPTLALWGAFYFTRPGQRFSWAFLGRSSGAVAAALAIYLLLNLLLSQTFTLPTGYYSGIFYNLTAGKSQRDNRLVFKDHPELKALPEAEQTRRIYQLSLDQLRSNPEETLHSAVNQWVGFVTRPWYSAFSFIDPEDAQMANDARYIQWINLAEYGLYTLSVLGLVSLFWRRAYPMDGLVGAAVLGVLLSVPFVPPELFNRVRFYAATAWVFAVLPAFGAAWLLRLLRLRPLTSPRPNLLSAAPAVSVSVLLVGFTVLGALGLRWFSRPTPYTPITCPAGQQAVYVMLSPRAYINIFQDDTREHWAPNYRVASFRRYMHNFSPHYGEMKEFSKFEPPYTLFVSLELASRRDIGVVIDTRQLPATEGTLGLCGTWGANPGNSMFYAGSAQLLTP